MVVERSLFTPKHRHPHPLLRQPHRTADEASRRRAEGVAALRMRHGRRGHHERAVVVSAANPAVVQLMGSDTLMSLPLAQHVTAAMLSPGGVVAVAFFDPDDPGDGLIVAAY